MKPVTVTCERVVFETHPRNREDAFLIDPRSFATWVGGAEVSREVVERAGRHGAFFAHGYLGAKVTAINGQILAPSQRAYEKKKALLTGMLVGRTGRMTVQEETRTTWADVGLSRQATVTDYGGDSCAGMFQVEVWSEDPFVYGEMRSFGPAASVEAYHRGNTAAAPRLVVPNGAASYSISSPGGTFTVAGITAGGTHEIDMRNGWVYRDGAIVWGVGSGDLWEIPAGPAWTHSISTGTLRVDVLDRYS